MNTKKEQNGYIILISVLIIGAISTAIAVSLLSIGLNSSKNSFSFEQSRQARALANSCIDLALLEIYNSSSYTGASSTSTAQGTCWYEVINTGGDARTINASSTVGPVIRKTKTQLDDVDPINIISWQEVADL